MKKYEEITEIRRPILSLSLEKALKISSFFEGFLRKLLRILRGFEEEGVSWIWEEKREVFMRGNMKNEKNGKNEKNPIN